MREGDPPLHAFPRDFLFGAATSSHQVEGDNVANDWWAWEREAARRIRDGRGSGRACEWWSGRAEDDLRLAAALGHGAHRLSLEWSRLEPRPGETDHRALDRYRAIVGAARDAGLVPMVTLNHFTLPRWARRGWLDPALGDRFAAFASRTVAALADLVDLWATLNEPVVLAGKAYAGRAWPPGLGRPDAGAAAVQRQLRAHARAYLAVKRRTPDARVGLVVNLPRFAPARPRLVADRMSASLQGWVVGGAVLHALATGWCRPPVGLVRRQLPELAGALDFLGVNYYGRYLIRFDPRHRARLGGRAVQPNSRRTESADWGQPWPRGLTDELVSAHRILGVPLYVTENGVFDPDDALRPRFIVEHVAAVHDALRAGADVRGYFHWSLLDNFEWAQGWSTPFGLVHLDLETQAREPRPSARVLEEIARARGVPRALAARFGLTPRVEPTLSGGLA